MMRLRGLRWVVAAVALGLVSVGVPACSCNKKENRAATAACARSVHSNACTACCGMHGSSVSTFFGKCTCY